jgi:hypothetical protein
MNTLSELYTYCREKITEYPDATDDLMMLYSLAEMEVADGSSENHEVELALFDIDDLIQVYKANTK